MEKDLELEQWEALEPRWGIVKQWCGERISEAITALSIDSNTPDIIAVREKQAAIRIYKQVSTLASDMERELEKQLNKGR